MKSNKYYKFSWWMVLFFLVSSTFFLENCKSASYENVSIQKYNDTIFFNPDYTSHFKPMTLNTKVSFAYNQINHKKFWGILFEVPYSHSIINRTIFTSVLYFTVVDNQLNSIIKKPIVLYKDTGNIITKLYSSKQGFGIAYIGKKLNKKKNNVIYYKEFNHQNFHNIFFQKMNSMEFPYKNIILKTLTSYNDFFYTIVKQSLETTSNKNINRI